MGTCLPPVMRTSRRERQEVLLCRVDFLCPFPTRRQRWTWLQRLHSLLSHLIPPLLQRPIYLRPTMSHAKRSTPKKLGQARNPPPHCLFKQVDGAADSQVTSRLIRDCSLAEDPLTSVLFCWFYSYNSLSSQKKVLHYLCTCSGLSQDTMNRDGRNHQQDAQFGCKQNEYELVHKCTVGIYCVMLVCE